MIDLAWAREFANEWIAAWNSHDLARILSHYTETFEMSSPLIIERMQESSGTLKGKERVGRYWQQGLTAIPPLRFELIDVFAGVESITLYYHSVGRKMVCEVLFFDAERRIVRGVSHHGNSAGPSAA
jgi:hypothetical protein